MTLASWFSSMRHSRRLTQTGARRNRSRAFRRRATFEAVEDRLLLSTVSFSTAGESVNASAGSFTIPVTLSGGRSHHLDLSPPGSTSPLAWPSTPTATSTSPTARTTRWTR